MKNLRSKRIKNATIYWFKTPDGEPEKLQITCSKKDGEIFESCAANILSLKYNVKVVNAAIKNNMLFLTDTDGTCTIGVIASNIDKAETIVNSQYKLFQEESGKFRLRPYAGENISDIAYCDKELRISSHGVLLEWIGLNQLAYLYNPYAFSETVQQKDGTYLRVEKKEYRERLKTVLEENMDYIKDFVGCDFNFQMSASYES